MRLGNILAGGVGAIAVVLSNCGDGAPEDVGVAMERHLESVVTYFNDMADALATVTDQASANAMAQRFTDEFNPRLQSMAHEVKRLEEAYPQDQLEASADVAARALDGRMERAWERFAGEFGRLEMQPHLQTAALEEAVLAWSEFAESLDWGAARSGGDPTISPGSTEWCGQMMRKPQGEWTMEEAFTFANRCVGG
jgi:hypothetical protein